MDESLIEIDVAAAIFTVHQGEVKVLLKQNNVEPYKGYWTLLNRTLSETEDAEDSVYDAIYDEAGITSLYMEQLHTFTKVNRRQDKRLITIAFIGLVDYAIVKYKQEPRDNVKTEWFNIDSLPKLAFDNDIILNKAKELLKNKITDLNILKKLYPSDFTMPELQKMIEGIIGKELDRRNFRKKFVNLGLVKDTGAKNEGGSGRPAKLYMFVDEIPEDKKELF